MKKLKAFRSVSLLLALGSAFLFASCDKEDEPTPVEEKDTIAVLAQNTADLSTLVTALQTADLVNTFNGPGPFTVFAPTNEAFNKMDPATLNTILGNQALLTRLLQYHVVSGNVMSGDLSSGAVTTLEGSSIDVDVTSGVVLNGSSNVISADIEASNGVVHLIDEVLMPDDFYAQTITQIAVSNPDFSILASILSQPEMSDLLAAASDPTSSLTVFAPTNDAFASLLATLSTLGINDISELPDGLLKEIVQYHIIGSAVLSSDLSNGDVATLLTNESVTIDLTDGVKVNNANVVLADVNAVNGVVHAVDQVLLPSFITNSLGTVAQDLVLGKQFRTLSLALRKANLLSVVSSTPNLTIFAPTNDAFTKAGITSLDGLDAEALTPILTYHVLGAKVTSNQLPASGIAETLNGENIYLGYLGSGGVLINGMTTITAVDNEDGSGVIHEIDNVLMPPAPDVVDIAAAMSTGETPEFTVLVSILTAAEYAPVLDALKAGENLTVFAPTDAAFAEIAEVIPTLSVEQITSILQYHVLGARVFSTDLSDGLEATTLNGQTFTVNLGSSVTITDQSGGRDANVLETNVHGKNGVIHVIDKVILPTL
ncbi:fasciclin domain-containing protein [Jiulongibacter sp. NS-SX5]|uniref:fasciclin domain-containing protein n=1 Tax=Jiulongibacter sp. NS-SX5 TaxID=3463854 RepID=UPI0040594C96